MNKFPIMLKKEFLELLKIKRKPLQLSLMIQLLAEIPFKIRIKMKFGHLFGVEQRKDVLQVKIKEML